MITGLSGAGRSQAADDLEDLGWFVIDNLPPSLIPKVSELAGAPGTTIDRVALVVGTGPYHEEVEPALQALRSTGARVRILFLDAATDVLIRRYESSRRPHPIGGGVSVTEAIEREREILEPVKAMADVVVDTSDLNVHQLRERVVELFGADPGVTGLNTSVVVVRVTSTGCRSTSTSCSTAGFSPTRTGSTTCARCRAQIRPCAAT